VPLICCSSVIFIVLIPFICNISGLCNTYKSLNFNKCTVILISIHELLKPFLLCGQQPSDYGRLLICSAPAVKSGQGKNSPPTHIPGSCLHLCMPLLSSVTCYLCSGLYSTPFVFSIIGVDRGEVCNTSSMDKQAAHLNPQICVHSFPDHRVLYLSQVLLRDQFLFLREVNATTDTQFKAVNSIYYIKLNLRLKCDSFIHQSVMVQLSHQTFHQSTVVG
jgi:hypothetical protein